MTPVPSSVPVPGVTVLTGPLYIGWTIGSALMGVLFVQCYIYYLNFPKDALWMKLYVLTILVIEVAFTVLTAIAGWRILGSGWGDPYHLYYMEQVQTPTPALCAIVTTMVHAFYCWRIVKLMTNKAKYLITGLIMTISMLQLVAVFITVEEIWKAGGMTIDSVRGPYKFVAIWLTSAAVADILIAITMVTLLVSAKRKVPFSHTAETLNYIIRLVIETGLITSIGAIVDCAFFLGFSKNNLHFAFFYMLAKLYSNTLLATLNSRANVLPRHTHQPAGHFNAQHRSAFWADYSGSKDDEEPTRSRSVTRQGVPIQVRMDEDVIRFRESDSPGTLPRKDRGRFDLDEMEMTPV